MRKTVKFLLSKSMLLLVALSLLVFSSCKESADSNDDVSAVSGPLDNLYIGMSREEVYTLLGEPDGFASGLRWFEYNDVGVFDPFYQEPYLDTMASINAYGKEWDSYILIRDAIQERFSNKESGFYTQQHEIMKITADKKSFTVEVLAAYAYYEPNGDYDVKMSSGSVTPIRLTFEKDKNNDYQLSSFYVGKGNEDWGWDGGSAIDSLQKRNYESAMEGIIGVIPSQTNCYKGYYMVYISNTEYRDDNAVDGCYYVKYFPGATIWIEKYTSSEDDMSNHYVIKYSDPQKNIIVGPKGMSEIAVTDDMLGVYDNIDNKFVVKLEKFVKK